MHFRPRLHQSHVVYTNVLDIYFDLKAKFGRASFEKKHKNELDRLYAGIEKVMENKPFDRQYLTNRILYGLCKIRVYENIFHKLGIKKFFAPSRANLLCHICPAKRLGVEVFEFQHGITYGETALYSGSRDSDFTPDRFLAFGDSQPRNVYGIDESKIYNIGWAFQDYIDKIQTGTKVGEHDILVISGPCLTDKILSATFRLAKESPDVHFVVRPHPAEVVTEEHRRSVEEFLNVEFQDPKINVAVAMRPYQNIIGENSTVLYEALTYGKKVARFCFDGFAPRYLTPEDEECFWKVNDMASFKAFIEGKPEDKKSMKIYSKFDKELFMKIYNS